MRRIKNVLLGMASVVAIPFILLFLVGAELYLDLTNIKRKGQNRKDGKRD